MRETVTLAAEADTVDVRASDEAFDAFIAAANIINELAPAAQTGMESSVYQSAITNARKAATHLGSAAHALAQLAPRSSEEPPVPRNPKFLDEK